jgi:PAS domain S-box-containing protein
VRAVAKRREGIRHARRDTRRALVEAAAASAMVAAIVLVALFGLWRTASRTAMESMRENVTRLASAVSSTIDPELHAKLRDPACLDTPEYNRAIAALRKAFVSTPGVKYMYTVVRDGEVVRFVLDAAEPGDHDGDGREDRSGVWEVYDDAEPEAFEALGDGVSAGRATASPEPYTDDWGTFITGYAPFFNADGTEAGVACVDVTAERFLAEQEQRARAAMLGLVPGGVLVLVVGAGSFLFRRHQLSTIQALRSAIRQATESAEQLAAGERRVRLVIDTALDAVVSMDADGTITDWNTQAERTFGWALTEAVGRPMHELIIPPEHRAAHLAGLRRYMTAGESRILGRRIEVPALRKDGSRLTAELAVTAVRTDDGLWFSAFLRDITEQKRAQLELAQAREAAEAASRAKSEFLANMSHEIRTPLTAILGYADILREDGDLPKAPQRRVQSIDTIRSAGVHLLSVINDILDLSKIEAGRMTVEEIASDLPAILGNVGMMMEARAKAKGLSLAVEVRGTIPSSVITDPTRLRQIVMNLAGNAVKFTEKGSVKITARTEGDGTARRLFIEVEDTGPGMTSEQATKLFAAFVQADATVTRKHGGTGLGLVISRRLAELMGGSLTLVRTEPGVGSMFRAEIPCCPEAGAVEVSALEQASAAREAVPQSMVKIRGRVLLAEDGADNQRLIGHHLRKAGAEVDVACDGLAALEMYEAARAEGRPYELLLTDMQMPRLDGYALAQELRSRGSSLAIVALTAHAMPEDRLRCVRAGCDDYATKPIDRVALLATCARWIGREHAVSKAA